MITRTLLLRGMLTGVFAGLLVFAFARWIGEPQVERAIAFETAADKARGEPAEPEMVSRRVQKSAGLLTGAVVYGTAVGGLFGLVFAFSYGRLGEMGPRALAAVLAGLGYVAAVVVPNLKYPANPPAVGNPETIGVRTGAYFLLMACSIAAMVFSLQLRRQFAKRFGEWNGSLLAAGLFVVVVGLVAHFLPDVDEVPAGFPVTLMWRFRVAALEIQAVLWGTLGLGFGWLAERVSVSGNLAARRKYR